MRTADVLRSAQPPLGRFWWALAAGTGTALSAVALLAASAWLITRSAEQPAIIYITAVVVAVRAFALSRGVFRYLERITGHDATLGQLAAVRADLVRRIVPLAPDGLGGSRRGALLSRLVDDVDELQNLPLRVVMPIVVAGTASIASVVFVVFLSPVAAMVLAACLAVAFVLAVWIGWLAGARAERRIAPLRSRLADALVDELSSLDVLTAFDATDAAHARVRAADEELRGATVRRAGAEGLTSGSVSLLAGVASLAVLMLAASMLGQGGFTGPALAVVVLLPMAVFEVFGPVPLALASWRQVRTAARRIATAVPDEVPAGLPRDEPPATGAAPPLGDGITLGGLSARWPARAAGGDTNADAIGARADRVDAGVSTRRSLSEELSDRAKGSDRVLPAPRAHRDAPDSETDRAAPGSTPATTEGDAVPTTTVDDAGELRAIDFHLAPGERVLVTGPSGAGKTTLAHVLVRFLDYEGSYRIGDVEARDINGDDVRRTVGLCEQSPYLFDESLRQNLVFARESAAEDELWTVLDRVGLGGWARERGGLDAGLGERGALVSGGQAQRIALARALLAEFPVLVLDEPTAGVDPAASDALLTDLLTAVDGDRAVLLISHVEVPAGLVDREVRIEGGRTV